MDRLILTGVLIIVIAALWMSGNEGRVKPQIEAALNKAEGAASVAEAVGIKANQLRLDYLALVKRIESFESATNANTESIEKVAALIEHIDKKAEAAKHGLAYLEMKMQAEMRKPINVVVSQHEPWLFRRSDLPLKHKLSEGLPVRRDPVHEHIIANVKSELAKVKPALDEVSK